MTDKIGVIGTPGKWSTEALADAIEARTGETVVATGTQTQRIFPRDVIDDIMRRAKTSSESSDQ